MLRSTTMLLRPRLHHHSTAQFLCTSTRRLPSRSSACSWQGTCRQPCTPGMSTEWIWTWWASTSATTSLMVSTKWRAPHGTSYQTANPATGLFLLPSTLMVRWLTLTAVEIWSCSLMPCLLSPMVDNFMDDLHHCPVDRRVVHFMNDLSLVFFCHQYISAVSNWPLPPHDIEH